jgi:hypothetical protein
LEQVLQWNLEWSPKKKKAKKTKNFECQLPVEITAMHIALIGIRIMKALFRFSTGQSLKLQRCMTDNSCYYLKPFFRINYQNVNVFHFLS